MLGLILLCWIGAKIGMPASFYVICGITMACKFIWAILKSLDNN